MQVTLGIRIHICVCMCVNLSHGRLSAQCVDMYAHTYVQFIFALRLTDIRVLNILTSIQRYVCTYVYRDGVHMYIRIII